MGPFTAKEKAALAETLVCISKVTLSSIVRVLGINALSKNDSKALLKSISTNGKTVDIWAVTEAQILEYFSKKLKGDIQKNDK